jgi:hypothetical protein
MIYGFIIYPTQSSDWVGARNAEQACRQRDMPQIAAT